MARAATRSEGGKVELDASMRIVVLHGRELFLLWEWSRMLAERLREAHGDVGIVRFDGASVPVAEVLDELRSFGLLEPHKLVIVDDADRFLGVESKRRSLEQYAASPEAQATLLLRAGTWRPGNFDKLVAKVGTILKCEPVSADKAIAWCIARASKRHEADLDREAAALLVERIGSDLGRLDGEIGKLSVSPAATAAGSRPRIDRALVASMVGVSREEEAWLIQEVVLSGDPGLAVRKVRELVSISRAAPQQLTWAVSELSRKLHGAASMRASGCGDGEISSTLRLWGDSKGPILSASRRLSPAATAAILDEAVDLDFRLKRGRAGDPARALEATAASIAARLGGPAGASR